jgi:uncharacterized membrane protein YeiH
MLIWFDYLGVVVFAMTGCLVAARRRVDIIGFLWLATVTGIGGGTLRDMILDRPVFWIDQPIYLVLCFITALILFFTAHLIHRRIRWVLWGDGLGLAVFAVIGTEIALSSGAGPAVAVTMGVITATFGGVMRDLLAGEPTLILRREIYVTAALVSGGTYFLMHNTMISDTVAVPIAILAGFLLRALALKHRFALPGYRTEELLIENRRKTAE